MDTSPNKPHNIGHVAMARPGGRHGGLPRAGLAISLGNGYILEARGRAYGVTIGPLRPSFNLASKVQELYTPAWS